jgi:hypothetical protein
LCWKRKVETFETFNCRCSRFTIIKWDQHDMSIYRSCKFQMKKKNNFIAFVDRFNFLWEKNHKHLQSHAKYQLLKLRSSNKNELRFHWIIPKNGRKKERENKWHLNFQSSVFTFLNFILHYITFTHNVVQLYFFVNEKQKKNYSAKEERRINFDGLQYKDF